MYFRGSFTPSIQSALMMQYADEIARYDVTQFTLGKRHDNDLLIRFIETFVSDYPEIYNKVMVDRVFFDPGEDRDKFEVFKMYRLYRRPLEEVVRVEISPDHKLSSTAR